MYFFFTRVFKKQTCAGEREKEKGRKKMKEEDKRKCGEGTAFEEI